jgi:hypothetical protein
VRCAAPLRHTSHLSGNRRSGSIVTPAGAAEPSAGFDSLAVQVAGRRTIGTVRWCCIRLLGTHLADHNSCDAESAAPASFGAERGPEGCGILGAGLVGALRLTASGPCVARRRHYANAGSEPQGRGNTGGYSARESGQSGRGRTQRGSLRPRLPTEAGEWLAAVEGVFEAAGSVEVARGGGSSSERKLRACAPKKLSSLFSSMLLQRRAGICRPHSRGNNCQSLSSSPVASDNLAERCTPA